MIRFVRFVAPPEVIVIELVRKASRWTAEDFLPGPGHDRDAFCCALFSRRPL